MDDSASTIDTAAATPVAAIKPIVAQSATVALDEPIQRGAQTITTITLRRPKTPDLFGLSLVEVAQMDVSALGRLVPRIADPLITEADVRRMDVADVLQLGMVVAGFLLPKSERATTVSPGT